MKINRTVETTLQHVSSVCSYCAASEVPVAMWFGKATLGSNSWFGKTSCFFQATGLEKHVFFCTFVQCTVSLFAGCFFKGVTGNTPVTQTIRKMKKNIIKK